NSSSYCATSTCSASVNIANPSTNVQIRVKDYTTNSIEAISGVFSVLSPRITLLKPNGGETFVAGTSQNITFVGNGQLYFGTYSYGIIELSTNSGVSWTTLSSAYQYFSTTTTNFPWTVPNSITNNALIRVRDFYTSATQSDTSNTVFSIISPQTFTTLPLVGINYCQGGIMNVAATSSGTFLSGNVFTVQLSNSAGSFASPITIGSLTATGASTGLIPCTLPSSLTAAAFYRVRVVASNPSITATDNGQNISIYNNCVNQPSITAGTVLCGATALSGTLGYNTPALGGLGAGNIVSVQLSDFTGNFANSTVIGTLPSTSLSGVVPFTIPAGLPSGSAYALRLTLSNPVAIGVPSNSFTINSVCISPTVVGSSFCANSPITINFNVVGNVGPNNVYTAKLYNGSSYYLTLGTLTSSGNGLLSMTVPTTNLYTGSGWRIAISASNPNTTDVFSVNTFSILSSCLNSLTISNATPCSGSALSVKFTSNISFSGSNIFTAEVSNNNFSTVAVIGTVLGNGIGTTTINGIVPGLPTASNYQVRVRASDFSTISPVYSYLTVSQLCIGVPTVSGSNCLGGNVSLTVPVNGVPGANNYYYIMYFNSSYVYVGTILSQASTATGLLNFNFSMPTAGGYYYQMAASDGIYNINNPTLTSPIFNVSNCINTPVLTLNSNCAGSGIRSTFTTNTTFTGANVFALEISSVTSFASSLFVGSVTGLGIGTSTILGTIPSVLANGNYYFRIKASDNNAVSPITSA
ncbi:MAG: hypothetical protein K2Q22_13375, partial [Cytophagales bacterium]|nr:hypothetical protein [Cytophagales bacterium]